MEFLAFQKAFTFLLGTTMVIKSFISDRHTSIAKWMREESPKNVVSLGSQLLNTTLTFGTLERVSYHAMLYIHFDSFPAL